MKIEKGKKYKLQNIKTSASPDGYPPITVHLIDEVPANMGLGGYRLGNDTGRRVFVPYEDAYTVLK